MNEKSFFKNGSEKAIEVAESEKIEKMREEISGSLDMIREARLFDEELVNNAALVVFSKREVYKFENEVVEEVSKDQYEYQDFKQGKRIDFVGITSRKDLCQSLQKALNEKSIFEVEFFSNTITYDEFIAHEMAHNLFDRMYKQENGEFDEKEGVSDVSDEYRGKIKRIIENLIEGRCPELDIEKFPFNRQQIAEIFAMLYQREFCRRSNLNLEVHNNLDEKAKEFLSGPSQMLEKFNKENDKSLMMDDSVYQEDHTLSLVVAHLLEEKYPDWEIRKNLFF